MNCAKCHFEFCWFCLTQYTSYRHKDNLVCPLVSMIKFLIYASLVTMVLNKLGLPYYFLCVAVFICSWAYWLFYYPLVMLLTCLFLFMNMKGIESQGRQYHDVIV